MVKKEKRKTVEYAPNYERLGEYDVFINLEENNREITTVRAVVPVNEEQKEFFGQDFEVLLLDGEYREFKKIYNDLDFGPLSEIELSGQKYLTKSVLFKTPITKSKYVYANLKGDSVLLDVEESDEIEFPNEDDPPEFPDEDDSDHKCCVTRFDTPADKYPQGKVPVHHTVIRGRRILFGAWRNEAVFECDESGCSCPCCQYRQYLKGFGEVTRGGTVVEKFRIWGKYRKKENGKIVKIPIPVPDYWQEDTKGKLDKEGNILPPVAYGHKPTQNPLQEAYWDKDCQYWMHDRPKWAPRTRPGDTTRWHLEFKGKIIDVCRRNPNPPTKLWNMKITIRSIG